MLQKQFFVFVLSFGLCASCTVDKKDSYNLECTLKQLKDAGNHPEWNNLTLINTENTEQVVLSNDFFKNVPNLNLLTINGVVNKIEEFAFRGLNKLENLTLEHNDITELPNINDLKSLKQYTVKNAKITEIPDNQFKNKEQLNYLMISSNAISHIGDCAFCGLDKTYLYLNNNTLKTFDPVRILGNVSFINGLNLDENHLTKIQRFGKMPNLIGVNYINNSISEIEENCFSHAPKFLFFDVSFNDVEVIEANIFPETVSDTAFFLILHNNKIQCLSPEMRNKFKNLRRLSLNDNAWKCDCLEDITQWAIQMDTFAGCSWLRTCIIPCVDDKNNRKEIKYY